MKLELRKYFWVVNLLTIGLCAYFAARATGSLVASALPESKRRALAFRPTALPQPLGSHSRDVSQILARNIFCSTCEPAAEVAVDPGAGAGDSDSGEASKTALNLKLLATLVSDQSPAFSYAAITDPDSGRTGLYQIGARVPGEATVEDILERKVMLRNGGRSEYLDLEHEAEVDRSATGYRPPPTPRPETGLAADLAQGVRKLGENKWEIQRSALNKVLGNTTLLARSARIVPSVRNGKPNGFKLYAIRPGSIYSLIGMQNGDTIHAINGHQMNTPDKALEVYTKVRNASHLTISFTRGGQTKTHDYAIR